MRRCISLAILAVFLALPVAAQPLNPPANMYIVSNARTDLVAAFPSLDRCQAAAAIHKVVPVGNGPVAVLLICVPTQ